MGALKRIPEKKSNVPMNLLWTRLFNLSLLVRCSSGGVIRIGCFVFVFYALMMLSNGWLMGERVCERGEV